MSDQLALWRKTDPATSREAALSIKDLGELEGMVLIWLQSHPSGGTSTEIAGGLGLPRDSISPRIPRLREKGLAIATDERRPGPSGRNQIVWRAI